MDEFDNGFEFEFERQECGKHWLEDSDCLYTELVR